MIQAIDIREEDGIVLRAILRQCLPDEAQVWAFGSRVTGRACRGSDLDLAIDAGRPLGQDAVAALREALENSDLPYPVDLVDLATASPGFRARIDSSLRPFPIR
ncbi:MAG: nucleotidyltransferase domain-containing protein [Alphaproteobacteria bacterium]|nr:MAG: nucleotidyltransferase domain-containing protein [Alphaproteobacteria bacterium]